MDDKHATPNPQPHAKPEERAQEDEAQGASPEENEFARLLEEAAMPPELVRGARITAEIVGTDGRAALLDVGAKSEVPIPLAEFEAAGLGRPRVGDTVEALVLSSRPLRLSVLEAAKQRLWEELRAHMQAERPVEVEMREQVKGGFVGRIGPLRAFLPWSEADLEAPRPKKIVGHRLKALVVEMSKRPEGVVVSRKRLLAKEREEAQQRFFAEAEVGARVKGRVVRVVQAGAFVELAPFVEAFLPASEITYRRIAHPREVLRRGQEVEAEIIELAPEEGRVKVSMKALEPDPWQGAQARYPVGARVKGRVVKLLEQGAIVELEPGLDGFVPRTELAWTRKPPRPSEVLAEGDEVEAEVLEVQEEARRMRLSLKAVQPNPWEAWLAEHPVGSRVKGTVRTKTDFGVFVRVGEELDGLVHANDLSWTESPEEALARIEVGEELECVVLGVDVARERISLGVKQLQDDPLELFLARAPKGSAVKGVVKEVREDGLVLELAPGVTGFVPRRELPRGRSYAVGEELEARVLQAEKKRRRVILSVRAHERALTRETMERLARESSSLPSPLALALKRALGGAKEEEEVR